MGVKTPQRTNKAGRRFLLRTSDMPLVWSTEMGFTDDR